MNKDKDKKHCDIDLIFMDCNMPFMDGYIATNKIRHIIDKYGLPQPIIVAVTGHTEQLYVNKAF